MLVSLLVVGGCAAPPSPTPPTGGLPPTSTPTPPEAAEIYLSNFRGTIYGYDWETFKLVSETLVGEGIRMTFSEDGRHLYVVSKNKNSLSIIDTKTNALEKSILLEITAEDIIYLPQPDSSCIALRHQKSIQVLSSADLRVLGTFKLNSFPYRLGCSPNGSVVYVIARSQVDTPPNLLVAIDPQDGRIFGRTRLREDWHELAIPQNGRHMCVSNRLSCSVTAVNLQTFQIEKTFEDIPRRQFPDSTVDGIAISPSDNYLYFCDLQSDYVRAIELSEGSIAKEITVDGWPRDIRISSSGRNLFIVHSGAVPIHGGGPFPGSINVVDVTSWDVTRRLELEHGASSIAVSPSLLE